MWIAGLALALTIAPPAEIAPGITLIPGTFERDRGPDGNSVFIDAPDGLILVDTGRHPAHRDTLLAFARERGRPIAAIVNSHWHLDHSTGNGDIKAAHPGAEIHASHAIRGALKDFLARSRDQAEARLAAGQVPPERRAEVDRVLAVMKNPDALYPTRPITASGEIKVAGRTLRLNLAPFAATEGDVWIFDEASRTVIAGDLVVAEVPFMDTACPEGWRRALAEIWATPFVTLIPGHGEPMKRAQFANWRTAYGNLLDCAASERARADCLAGWRTDAASFIRPGREALIDEMVGYYLDTRLRAKPEERDRYCRGSARSAS